MTSPTPPVTGYRDLTPDEVNMINAVKAAEGVLGELWRAVKSAPGTDTRWLDIARNHFEEGCSALVKSIARPESPF